MSFITEHFINQRFKNKPISYLSGQNYKNTSNPQSNLKTESSKARSNSIFIAEIDKIQKTKALWRKFSPTENRNNKKLAYIASWSDLDKLKIKYRTEVFKSKSKQKIFQQNIQLIQNVEEVPPKIDTWSYCKLKRTPRASTDQLLIKNLQLIKKIQETQPKIDNWNFRKPKLSPRSKQRQLNKLKVFQQNIKIIQRVESVTPKIQTWNLKKPKRNKQIFSDRRHNKQKLFQQNMKLIDRVQGAPPKVESWADIKNMRKLVQRKRLQGFLKANQTISKMQRIIQEAQRKLVEKDLLLMNQKKIKTLPNLTPLSRQKLEQRKQHKKNINRLTLKIEKSKAAVDCWSKAQQKIIIQSNINKIIKIENKNKSGGILQKAKKINQLKYMNKNIQLLKLSRK